MILFFEFYKKQFAIYVCSIISQFRVCTTQKTGISTLHKKSLDDSFSPYNNVLASKRK